MNSSNLSSVFSITRGAVAIVLLTDILAQIQSHMRRSMTDPFAAFKSMDHFDIYAGDGHFIAAASHDNLMTLMEEQLFRDAGIRNEAETKRKGKALAKRDEQSQSRGGGALTVLLQCIQRFTQRTVKFIRWLENHLDSTLSWAHALAHLTKIHARS